MIENTHILVVFAFVIFGGICFVVGQWCGEALVHERREREKR